MDESVIKTLEETARTIEDCLLQKKGTKLPFQEVLQSVYLTFDSGDKVAFSMTLSELRSFLAGNSFPEDGIGIRDILYPIGQYIGKMFKDKIEIGLSFLQMLAEDDSVEVRCLACRALGEVGKSNMKTVLPIAYKLSKDKDWRVREFLAHAFDEEISKTFPDLTFDLMGEWVKDRDENVRRVPTNALLRYGRRNPERVIELMEKLLHDDSLYVRKSVYYCLQNLGKVNHPILGFPCEDNPKILIRYLKKWVVDPNKHTRWIIAKTLGDGWTAKLGKETLTLLKILAADEDKEVREAVASTLKKIVKHYPHRVWKTVNGWAMDKNENVKGLAMRSLFELVRRGNRCHTTIA